MRKPNTKSDLKPEDRQKISEVFTSAFRTIYNACLPTARGFQGRVHEYPDLRYRSNHMPFITGIYSWDSKARINFSSAISGPTLLSGPFGGIAAGQLTPCMDLGELFWTIPALRNRLDKDDRWSADYNAKILLQSAVVRYLEIYGPEEFSEAHGRLIAKPFIDGLNSDELGLTIVVPILMHTFEVDRFRLSEDAYLFRMSTRFQLARSANSYGSAGVTAGVAQAATHALALNYWSIRNLNTISLSGRLTDISDEAFRQIDTFFAALRTIGDAVSGYAQVIVVPRRWAYEYKWDLPSQYVSEHRRYPNSYDRLYFKDDHVRSVPNDMLSDLKKTFKHIHSAKQNNIQLALRRLNACVTRDDDEDAILDAIIGIELLLGGDKSDSITFKLRMRVAGLSKLTNGMYDPAKTFKEMAKLYETRSAIVHGSNSKKASKNIEIARRSQYAYQRALATQYLRMVISTLLDNPKYRDPTHIDRDLLIGGGVNDKTEDPVQAELPMEDQNE